MDGIDLVKSLVDIAKKSSNGAAEITVKSGALYCEWNGSLPFLMYKHWGALDWTDISTAKAVDHADE